MENQYNKTITACFVGYIVQAVINNFTPLLFLFFQKSYHIPLSQITLLVTFNFGIQLLVDLLSCINNYSPCSIGGRFNSSYGLAGDFTSTLYRNFDCCNDLCNWWWTFGSSSQSGC